MTEYEEVAEAMRTQAPRFSNYSEAIAYVSKSMPGESGAVIDNVAAALYGASPVTIRVEDGRILVKIFEGGASRVAGTVRFEQALQLQAEMRDALLATIKDSLRRCPSCESTQVQVSIPTWYREVSMGALITVGPENDADVQFWHCAECGAGGEDRPSLT